MGSEMCIRDRMCRDLDVGHVINNAYGVQARQLCAEVTRAWRRGRVDAVVQSTDKNFMVPVGGAVVTSGASDTSTVDAVRKSYPGRASASPVVDLLITLPLHGRRRVAKIAPRTRRDVRVHARTTTGDGDRAR